MSFIMHAFFKYLICTIAILSLAGCASKLEQYNQPSKNSSFILQKNLYWEETLTFAKVKCIYGLRAGTYKLVKENSEGYFYKGKDDSVFFLKDKLRDNFLKNGEIAPYKERRKNFIFYGGPGGLWVSKKTGKRDAKLFYLVSENEGRILVGAILGGAVGTALAANSEPTLNIEFNQNGYIRYFPFVPGFLNELPSKIFSD